MEDKNCGNCNYCVENGEDLVCVNNQSEYLGDFVEPDHCCCDYEGDGEDDKCE